MSCQTQSEAGEPSTTQLVGLPDSVLDAIVEYSLKGSPQLTVPFLSSCGSVVHKSAVRVVFHTIVITDEADALVAEHKASWNERPVLAILLNPQRYSVAVKRIEIEDILCNYLNPLGRAYNPLGVSEITHLLSLCHNLEELSWRSPVIPPNNLCKTITAHNPRVSSFAFAPTLYPKFLGSNTLAVRRWDANTLSSLSTCALTELRITRLSQRGAQTLCRLLSQLGEFSVLEDVSFSFLWLDDAVLGNLAAAGRRLRRLQLSTSGTKLSDKGMVAVLENCEALESLSLINVEGRLSRSLWSKPFQYPPALRTLEIEFSETRQHHSWAADHLLSVHEAPLELLNSLSIVRTMRPTSVEKDRPIFKFDLDDFAVPRKVPDDVLAKLLGSKSLTSLACDWWAWSVDDLKTLLDKCPKLLSVQVCLDAPFTKLLSMCSLLSSSPSLRELRICIAPPHAPGTPPLLKVPTHASRPPTPNESPKTRSKPILPHLLSMDQMHNPARMAPQNEDGDPSMPCLRDVKRFVRKSSSLVLLDWYGKDARGQWHVTRPKTASKISINVIVDYRPPAIGEKEWADIMLDNYVLDAYKGGFVPSDIERPGQVLDEEEFVKEASPERTREHGRLRSGSRNDTFSKVSDSDNELHISLCSDSPILLSPVSLSPLTPPDSAASLSSLTSYSEMNLHGDEPPSPAERSINTCSIREPASPLSSKAVQRDQRRRYSRSGRTGGREPKDKPTRSNSTPQDCQSNQTLQFTPPRPDRRPSQGTPTSSPRKGRGRRST